MSPLLMMIFRGKNLALFALSVELIFHRTLKVDVSYCCFIVMLGSVGHAPRA